MRGEAECMRLQHQRHSGCAGVVLRAAVHFALGGARLGGHGDQHGRGCIPALVERHEGRKRLLERDFVDAAVEHDKAPRLCVIRRRRPACRLQHGVQILAADRLARIGARAPAAGNQIVNGNFGWGRFLGHALLSVEIHDRGRLPGVT